MTRSPWDATQFEADLATLDPPATWIELARMNRAGRWPSDRHREVFETWHVKVGQHLIEIAGRATKRNNDVTPILKASRREKG